MMFFRQFLACFALVLLGVILGASLYETVVLAPNFQANVPGSLEHFRLFMQRANPGTFFRVASPATQVALLLCVVFGWRIPGTRWWFLGALCLMVSGDVMTFIYHYPRNAFLFREPLTKPVADLARVAAEWANGNLVRVALVTLATICAALALRCSLQSQVGNGNKAT